MNVTTLLLAVLLGVLAYFLFGAFLPYPWPLVFAVLVVVLVLTQGPRLAI
jgi:hypothetical protein